MVNDNKQEDNKQKDTRSRKWQLTINNPQEHELCQPHIKKIISEHFSNIRYYCMSDEIGENGTYHIHLFMYFDNARRFSTLKKHFSAAHFEMARGTCQQNRDYVFKEGKWADNKKADTNIKETHFEYGEIPVEKQGGKTDMNDLYDMIKSGMDNYSIIEEDTSFMFNLDKIDIVRQTLRQEKYKNTFRELNTTYIYGDTGSGKTRSVMEKYGYSEVYRVTDYLHPFDNYKGQDVVIFEEFRSSFRVQDMLNYLDGYPCELPARYNNKIACFTKVYIITNIPINEQYKGIQTESKETYKAFLRRIHNIYHITNGKIQICSINDEYIAEPIDEKEIEEVLGKGDNNAAV